MPEYFSYMHATFWLGTEQCSNRRRNLVPDKSGARCAWHTYQKPAPDKWSRFMAPVSGECVMGLQKLLLEERLRRSPHCLSALRLTTLHKQRWKIARIYRVTCSDVQNFAFAKYLVNLIHQSRHRCVQYERLLQWIKCKWGPRTLCGLGSPVPVTRLGALLQLTPVPELNYSIPWVQNKERWLFKSC